MCALRKCGSSALVRIQGIGTSRKNRYFWKLLKELLIKLSANYMWFIYFLRARDSSQIGSLFTRISQIGCEKDIMETPHGLYKQ